MKRLLVILIAGLIVFPGCSWFGPKKEKTAQELTDEGMKAFNKKNYRVAIDAFSDLKNWYPFSKHAVLADLKIADSYYKLEEYDEAVLAYSDFENLHPRNEAVPEVIFKIGLCYFEQIDKIDRDQSNTLKALNTFKRLHQQFPENTFAIKGLENINICLESLAGHEFYVGKFYFKSKHFKAAMSRFQTVVSSYANTKVFDDANDYIAKCQEMLKDPKNDIINKPPKK